VATARPATPAGLAVARRGGSDPVVSGRNCGGGRRRTAADGVGRCRTAADGGGRRRTAADSGGQSRNVVWQCWVVQKRG